MQRTRQTLTTMMGVALMTAITAMSGCVLSDDFMRISEVFPCEDDGDCSEPGYSCDPSSNTCTSARVDAFCKDQDKDGYSAEEVREECVNAEKDPDDTDPDIYPGSPERCDGKDNDADGQVDELFDCSAEGDLGCYTNFEIPREDTLFSCIKGRCVLLPARSTGECEGVTLACKDGAYDDTEAITMGCIQP